MDKQIHELTNTATDFAADDYIAVDNATDQTRKMAQSVLKSKMRDFTLGDIHNLATTATESDLVSGNYLAIDGANGTKKLPAEDVAKRSVQDNTISTNSRRERLNGGCYCQKKIELTFTNIAGTVPDKTCSVSIATDGGFFVFYRNNVYTFSAGETFADAPYSYGMLCVVLDVHNNSRSKKVFAMGDSTLSHATISDDEALLPIAVWKSGKIVWTCSDRVLLDETISRTESVSFGTPVDGFPNATITKNKYLKSDGTIASMTGNYLISVPVVNGYNYVKFTGNFWKQAVSLFQLDENDAILVSKDYDQIATISDTLELVNGAKQVAFNCTSDYMECSFVIGTTIYVTEYAKEIDDEIEKNDESLSKYNKHKTIAKVPKTFYKGNLDSYSTWGTSESQYSTVITRFEQLLVPNYSYKESIGYSSDNREMFVYKFTPPVVQHPNNFVGDIPSILIICAQHGFEKAGTFGMWYFLHDLIENSDKDELLDYFRNNVNIYVVPCANPYGFDNNSYTNANGVNLNRNWYVPNWTKTTTPSSEVSGDAPFDQPETLNIKNYVDNSGINFDFVIDFHQYGNSAVEIKNINWTEYTTPYFGDDLFYKRLRKALLCHHQHLTPIIREIAGDSQLGITGTEGEETRTGNITKSSYSGVGYCDAYFILNHTIAFLCEGFKNYPQGDSNYSASVKQGNAAIIASLLQNVLCEFEN